MSLRALLLSGLMCTMIFASPAALAAYCQQDLGYVTHLEYQQSRNSNSYSFQNVETTSPGLQLLCRGSPSGGSDSQTTTGAPADVYRNSDGTYSSYENGQLTPQPNYTPTSGLQLTGQSITMVERDQATSDGTICQKTFCLEFKARHVTNYTVGYGYRYTGRDMDTDLPYENPSAWKNMTMSDSQYDLGRPVVTGGNLTLSVHANVRSCNVEAFLTSTSANDPDIVHRTQKVFNCTRS